MMKDSEYGRLVLAAIVPEVRKHVPGVKLREAWVWHAGRDHWEFHFHEFYWHGSAAGAYDARYQGAAYLRSIGVDV